jgi:putative ABC transport system ATP-binding protein/lipoprotein-releasing system ATP-binding protein
VELIDSKDSDKEASTVLRAASLVRSFCVGSSDIEVLRGMSLEISRSERLFLCGASGAGKSTLLYTLAGLERPDSGSVEIDGQSLYSLSAAQQTKFRNEKIGYVFQNYFLLPDLTALENVSLPALIKGSEKTFLRAAELLEQVGLGDRLNHRPTELSGGEQQRVAIARSLINDPQILFADEPTGNLDSKNGKLISDLLFEVNSETDNALVVVTHDHDLAKKCDKTISLKLGKIVE